MDINELAVVAEKIVKESISNGYRLPIKELLNKLIEMGYEPEIAKKAIMKYLHKIDDFKGTYNC